MGEAERRGWWRDVLGWDGGLPLLVALSPEFLPLVLPGRDLPELVPIVFLPLVAGLWRAHLGDRQIRRFFPGPMTRVRLRRESLFGTAIIVLIAFESLVAGLQIHRTAIGWLWLVALGLYLSYLGLITIAIRSARASLDR